MNTQLRHLWREIDDRLGDRSMPPLLSVSQTLGVVRRELISDKPPRADSFDKYKICDIGDLVLNRFNAYRGSLGISTERGIVSPDYLVLRPTRNSHPKFLEFMLRSEELSNFMKSTMGGLGASDPDVSGFSRIDVGSLGQYGVPRLEFQEQLAIAEFLDREILQIDDLIDKQERLIELLAEKRQAVITQAVTKGLDPSASTKSSGVPWLGAIPTHWKIGPVRRFYEIVLGKMRQREQETALDVLRPYLKAASVQPDGMVADDTNKMWFSPAEVSNLSLRPGDVLVVEGGSIGQSVVVDATVSDYGFEKSLNRVRPQRDACSEYFHLYMVIARASGYVAMQCSGATLMHLPSDKLGRMVMPFPPESEQREIVKTVQQRLSALSGVQDRCRRLIGLLQERRSALISAAVTGKIDVREGAV
ncbi:hypothetical protein LJ753_11850 [Arthrobacter sp. zg-Y20]|uniref:hypothetical protein n=1 Tax=unclassified Arthrobacter TaxID=235627 RepID=UPI001D144711|nr:MULTISPECIES: hypothetical protein [unclassified Arthrobacter]MCC3276562.1 hypothetical protein [Arthrobacter sp. zg-Y20]MDK1316722.1 hypothetical protein [Arthrobacter sp. zg.Y20]WIB06855.1 hypothetical protein QNO06_03750 [Arthrobacter sp. zg-Y20]